MTPTLKRQLEHFLFASGPATPDQLLQHAADAGYPHITKRELMELLQRSEANGWVRQTAIPNRREKGWALTERRKETLGLVPKPAEVVQHESESRLLFDRLYNWQKQAVCAWEARHHRGIVEAVTGSGKTKVALAAWERLKSKQKLLHTLIVVPTIPLMNQWHEAFHAEFPEKSLGRIGGGHHDDFSRFSICVAVVNSAVRRLRDLFEHLDRCPAKTFLIADECHRYIDPEVFSRIRRFSFNFSLGLSATIDPFQVDGLGQVVCTYRFGDAVRDGLIPRFDLVNCPVPMTPGEAADYRNLSLKLSEQFDLVKDAYQDQLQGVTGNQVFRKLQSMLKQPEYEHARDIRRLFGLMFRRASISYKAENKMELAKEILLLLLNGKRKMLVFFERIQSAADLQDEVEGADRLEIETANALAEQVGVNWCKVLHSGLGAEERRERLEEFRSATVAALLVCRVLDEGVDVPDMDAAIMVASTQSVRQRIQRTGRVLRRKEGKKKPLVVTLYVPETSDRNVVVDDYETFAEAADVHRVAHTRCVEKLRALL
jgi:RNA polymerase primary sigma factor